MRNLALLSSILLVMGAGCGGGPGHATGDGGHNGDGGNNISGDGGNAGGDGSAGACVAGLQSIALTPAASTVTLDGGPAANITFTATGTFAGGATKTVDPARLTWSATRTDATPPGTIAAGVLTPYASAGGVVTIAATDGCVTGSTTVTFVLKTTIGTPSDPGAWSGTPVTGTGAPDIVYPSDQTRFPRNIYRTLFQWNAGKTTEYRLTFDGPGSKVIVYTDGQDPDCAMAMNAGCWRAGQTAWNYIAASNAGKTVTWTVDGLDKSTTPPTVRRSASITIGFSKQDVQGAIFYWSTTSAGVRRANISAATPEDYIAGKPATVYPPSSAYPNGDQVKCVACHVVSRDGKYMAAPVQADSGQSLWIMQVSKKAPPPPLVKSVANTGGHGFATISPDDSLVAAAWGGKMWIVHRTDGSYIEDVPTAGPATEPDWSPKGDQIAYATGMGDAPGNASIATIPFMSVGNWGTPKILVQAANKLSNLFPSFSPGGDWIAFSRGKGGHDDLQAQLFIVPASGGTPVELVNANRIISNQTTNGQFENSQPTWAPPGDLYWIAFNSQRAYGVVQGAGTQQIWVAAIDPNKLGTGKDPSFPAFRLQFQGLQENNHRAYWTLDIRQPQPPSDGGVPGPDAAPAADAGACIAAGQMCDPVSDVCCGTNYVCDTQNSGQTYTCIQRVIQ